MDDESVVTNYHLDDDQVMDNTIRPESIDEYIGQEDVKENDKIWRRYIWKVLISRQCGRGREIWHGSSCSWQQAYPYFSQ